MVKVSKYLHINVPPWEKEKIETVLQLQNVAQEKSFPIELAPVTIIHQCLFLTVELVHHF